MQIGQQVVEVLPIEIGHGRHQVAAMQDGFGHALVRGRCAAVQRLLLEDAQQRWPMQGRIDAIVMALRAVGLEDVVAGRVA
jgi:hypothetical protein